MDTLHEFRRRLAQGLILASACLIATLGLLSYQASAAELTQRSLSILNPTAGATTTYTFTFTDATLTTPVGSVDLSFCDSPLEELPCVAPPGLDASGAVLAAQTGETGFSILSQTANDIVLSRTAATLPSGVPAQYEFTGVVNPTGSPGTFYVRIHTYQATNASGSPIDFGAVVNSTTQGITISTQVPPYLKFCVGVTISGDCDTASGNLIDLGDLTSLRAASGTSQMIAATNASFGLVIGAYGTTMTSGNNTIKALTTPTVSAPGNSQFGINLRQNSNPSIGEDPSGGGVANPSASYDIPNSYAFNNGDTLASSPAGTDTRKFTVSYIVNVPPAQAPGIYATTITYVCTPSF